MASAKGLFEAWPFQPVRLIGVTAEKLSTGEEQPGLFVDEDREKQRRLDQVADRINDRFGETAIRRGGKA